MHIVEQSGDFVWDGEESGALRDARKDAEITLSVDSVRAYLKQIGNIRQVLTIHVSTATLTVELGSATTRTFPRTTTQPVRALKAPTTHTKIPMFPRPCVNHVLRLNCQDHLRLDNSAVVITLCSTARARSL